MYANIAYLYPREYFFMLLSMKFYGICVPANTNIDMFFIDDFKRPTYKAR